jgi:hypothetical protein
MKDSSMKRLAAAAFERQNPARSIALDYPA